MTAPYYQPDPSAADILAAMRAQGAFMDITPNDAATLFQAAHQFAVDRLHRSVLVRDLMTADLLTLTPDMEARQAVRMLAQAGVSGAPVLRAGVLAGVVSIKDFLPLMDLPKTASAIALAARLFSAPSASGRETAASGAVPVETIMTAPALTIAPGATAFEAARIMAGRSVSRLPVTEEDRLVGILSRSDLIRAFGDMLAEVS